MIRGESEGIQDLHRRHRLRLDAAGQHGHLLRRIHQIPFMRHPHQIRSTGGSAHNHLLDVVAEVVGFDGGGGGWIFGFNTQG